EQITNNATNFVLFQNYPNPFNAISKIKYKISKTEFRSQNSEVRIIVYNITGKEIGTLVNKKQSSGEYEVKFDGSNLGSGIYFYTLFVDEIRVDTKKAVLIK
ncbi:MAG: T9SS type A sorting domain-containing protein, partial [Ignavibacteriae bacterium]|nr:T9SS type A sorting domain-containing protein [Ignavibacteriota bacterium]